MVLRCGHGSAALGVAVDFKSQLLFLALAFSQLFFSNHDLDLPCRVRASSFFLMDANEICEIEDDKARWLWVLKYTESRETTLCEWVSDFHPRKLKCEIYGPDARSDRRGAYNIVSKVHFHETNETWAVRFPQNGNGPISDEKLEAEVAAINIVRRYTDIPIPDIKAWGYAHENKLGLGPFLISAWVDGICLVDFLPSKDGATRLLRDDIPDSTIQRLWRQIARFMLQLSRINFDYIGSCTTTPRRPLSIKSHQILEDGVELFCASPILDRLPKSLMRVVILGPPSKTFTSSLDYFRSIADHDLHRLYEKPNSVDDEEDARQKFINWTVLRQLVTRFISSEHGPFKLICDDFGPMNMMVNNEEDLQIVAVLDWEWSYSGPSELFWSPPLWLLGQHPVYWEDGDLRLTRYFKNLDLWIQIMQQEEGILNDGTNNDTDLPSAIIRKHQKEGSMWFFHIMHEANLGPTSVPFARLRASVSDYCKLAAAVSVEKTEEFVQLKLEHLQRYEEELAEAKRRHN